jgi:hypothetical protein
MATEPERETRRCGAVAGVFGKSGNHHGQMLFGDIDNNRPDASTVVFDRIADLPATIHPSFFSTRAHSISNRQIACDTSSRPSSGKVLLVIAKT